MQVKLNIDADTLINSIMANYPEASSPSLKCIGYRYDDCRFAFWDVESTPKSAAQDGALIPFTTDTVETFGFMGGKHEDQVIYTVDLPALRRGLETVLGLMAGGKLRGIAKYVMPDVTNPGNWDSDAADALVQCSIFGEVRYG